MKCSVLKMNSPGQCELDCLDPFDYQGLSADVKMMAIDNHSDPRATPNRLNNRRVTEVLE